MESMKNLCKMYVKYLCGIRIRIDFYSYFTGSAFWILHPQGIMSVVMDRQSQTQMIRR